MKTKAIKVGELKEMLATMNENYTVDVQISQKYGATITAKAIRVEKVGKSIVLFGFEK